MRLPRIGKTVFVAGMLLALAAAGCGTKPAAQPQPAPAPAPAPAPKPAQPAVQQPKPAAAPAQPAQPAAAAKPATQYRFFFGTTSTSSSHYAYAVAAANAITAKVPNVAITVVETGGSGENLKRMQKGEFQFAITAPTVLYPAFHGMGDYKDKPLNTARLLWVYTNSPLTVLVREDSGVKALTELAGKNFNPCARGAACEEFVKNSFEVLNIKPNYFVASLPDAVAAFKDKRIIGFSKPAAGRNPDASVLEVQAFTPIRVLGYSQQDLDKVLAKYPWYAPARIPANTYKGDWNKADILTLGAVIAISLTNDVPEQVAYDMTKAVWENREPQVKAFADFALAQPGDILEVANTPLHAGAVRYYRGLGLKVPDKLLPPEIK